MSIDEFGQFERKKTNRDRFPIFFRVCKFVYDLVTPSNLPEVIRLFLFVFYWSISLVFISFIAYEFGKTGDIEDVLFSVLGVLASLFVVAWIWQNCATRFVEIMVSLLDGDNRFVITVLVIMVLTVLFLLCSTLFFLLDRW